MRKLALNLSKLQNEGIEAEGFKPSKHYKEMGYEKLDKSGKSL